MHLLMLAGDGIGPEITAATKEVLAGCEQAFGLTFQIEEETVGLDCLKQHGTTFTPGYLERARAVDGIVVGPLALSEYRGAAYGEPSPSMFLRKNLDLFANIRPSRTYPGLPTKAGDFDLVIARENTEGFYADRNMEFGNADLLVTPDVAVSLRRITRQCTERIAHEAFKLAQQRRKHVTIIHKSNVLKVGDGLFLRVCNEVAKQYADVAVGEVLVDAMVALLVRDPSRFDVILASNMYGDILSDLTAELSGSLGLGGSINAGSDNAMAQASHGSAPDIAGQGIANPFSLILSTALLLMWHGARAADPRFIEAGRSIQVAVEQAIAEKETTRDIGGRLGTAAVGSALAKRIRESRVKA